MNILTNYTEINNNKMKMNSKILTYGTFKVTCETLNIFHRNFSLNCLGLLIGGQIL